MDSLDTMGEMKIPVLYSLEELFLLSQPLNKTMEVYNEKEASLYETDLADEPPRKRLKPSRPLKKRNNAVVKLEAKEFFQDESDDQSDLENDAGQMRSDNKPIEGAGEENMSMEDFRQELKTKQKIISDLQDQFVIVQSENLYKDSEIKDLQEKVSSHLKTSAELLMTINSLKSKVDMVKISESKQVQALELKISQVESENRSLKKNNASAGDHTDCEKKKKDLLIERLKIFQKFSEEEKVSARLLSKVTQLELENVNLKTNQEKLNNSLELKTKESYEDKKNLAAAEEQLESHKQELLQEATKEEDLRRKVEGLELKMKKYKTLLRKTNQENFSDLEDQEAEETKAGSPIIFSSLDQQSSSDDKEKNIRSFDARMFQIAAGGNNNEKDEKNDEEDCEDLSSPKPDKDVVNEVVDVNKETIDKTSEISQIGPKIVTNDTSFEAGDGKDIQFKETEDKIKEVDSLDEPMFNELVIDLKEDMESTDAEDTSNDNLVIDLQEESHEEENKKEGSERAELANCCWCGEREERCTADQCRTVTSLTAGGVQVRCEHCQEVDHHLVAACPLLLTFCLTCHTLGHEAQTHHDERKEIKLLQESFNKHRLKHFRVRNKEDSLPENSLTDDGEYRYAGSLQDLTDIAKQLGLPCLTMT